MDLKHAKRDEVIFRQGEASACMYRVQKGTVGIFLDYGGANENKLTELAAGRYFGEMGLLDKAPRSATAVVLSDRATLQVIREEDFALCFEENPAGMLALLRQMSMRLRRITRDYDDACRTVGEVVEAEKAGMEPDAALEHRIAKTLAGYEASHLENQREEAEA